MPAPTSTNFECAHLMSLTFWFESHSSSTAPFSWSRNLSFSQNANAALRSIPNGCQSGFQLTFKPFLTRQYVWPFEFLPFADGL